MFLLINLSTQDRIQLVLFDNKNYISKTYSQQNRELLICIDKFLTTNKLPKEKLSGIVVVVGHGGFTSTRIATVIANTLAYALKIPVLAINNPNQDKKELQKLIPQIKKQPIGQYISATYSAEASIGPKKKKT